MVGQVGLYVMDMNGKDVGKLLVKTATLSEVENKSTKFGMTKYRKNLKIPVFGGSR